MWVASFLCPNYLNGVTKSRARICIENALGNENVLCYNLSVLCRIVTYICEFHMNAPELIKGNTMNVIQAHVNQML